jgi:hypothetical protein
MKAVTTLIACMALSLCVVCEQDEDPPTQPTASERCAGKYSPNQVCAADDSSCTFYVVLDNSSCAAYCAAHGGQCLGAAWNQSGADHCVVEETTTCDDDASDQICTCTQ